MTIGERIKKIRTDKRMTQTEFAALIGLNQPTIGQMETGVRNATKRSIMLICEKCDINKEWLESGKGEQYKLLSKTQKIMKYTALLLKDTDSAIAEAIINFIITYEQLDAPSKKVLDDVARTFVENMNKDKS